MSGSALDTVFPGLGARNTIDALRAIYGQLEVVASNTGGGGGGGGSSIVQDIAVETALGTPADTAWAGTGSASLASILKGVYTSLNTPLNINLASGAATAALQTSGNTSLGTIATNTTGIATSALQTAGNTVLGTVSDAAWSGTGNSSLVASLKAIFTKVNGTLAVSLGSALPAGANAIGTVSVTALPALPVGANAIGTVGVTALPALPAGANAIGSVSVSALPALPTGANAIGTVGVTSLPTLPAGTNQIGTVTAGGYTTMIQLTPGVQVAAYVAGQCVGNLIAFASAARVTSGSGLIQSIIATFVSGSVPSLDVIIFNASPTASTTSDRTAVAIATADLGKIVGVVHLTDSVLLGASSPSIMQGMQQAMPFKLPSGTTLYASVVTRSAMSLTSTSDMIVSINILQD